MVRKDLREKHPKKLIRSEVFRMYEKAMLDGEYVLDYSKFPNADKVADEMWKIIRDWRTVVRRNPQDRQGEWVIAQCCTLIKPKEGKIKLKRKPNYMEVKAKAQSFFIVTQEAKNKEKTNNILTDMRKNVNSVIFNC